MFLDAVLLWSELWCFVLFRFLFLLRSMMYSFTLLLFRVEPYLINKKNYNRTEIKNYLWDFIYNGDDFIFCDCSFLLFNYWLTTRRFANDLCIFHILLHFSGTIQIYCVFMTHKQLCISFMTTVTKRFEFFA